MNENNNYDYGYTYGEEENIVRGDGAYTNVPYNPEISVIANINGVTLQSVTRTVGTVYEIRWDGEVLMKHPNLKNAEAFFIDCADITKAKYNKIKAAA